MNLLLQRVSYGLTEAAKKWTVAKNKFLVPVKPKRPLSAFFLYCQQRRPNMTGTVTQKMVQAGVQWKTLSTEEKQKYNEQFRKHMEKHSAEIAQYEKNYVEPLKIPTYSNLAVVSFYKNSDVKIANRKQGSQKLKQCFTKLTEEDKKKYQAMSDDLKKQRREITQPFLIPEAQFKTQRSFVAAKNREKNIKSQDLSVEQRTKLKQQYNLYIEQFNKKKEEFAKKYNLTLKELNDIIKLHQRKMRKEDRSERLVDTLGEPYLTKVKRTRTVAAKTTGSSATSTTTRTKKAGTRATTKKATTKKAAAKNSINEETTTKKTQTESK